MSDVMTQAYEFTIRDSMLIFELPGTLVKLNVIKGTLVGVEVYSCCTMLKFTNSAIRALCITDIPGEGEKSFVVETPEIIAQEG